MDVHVFDSLRYACSFYVGFRWGRGWLVCVTLVFIALVSTTVRTFDLGGTVPSSGFRAVSYRITARRCAVTSDLPVSCLPDAAVCLEF